MFREYRIIKKKNIRSIKSGWNKQNNNILALISTIQRCHKKDTCIFYDKKQNKIGIKINFYNTHRIKKKNEKKLTVFIYKVTRMITVPIFNL